MIPAKVFDEPEQVHLTGKYNRAIMKNHTPMIPNTYQQKPLKTRIIKVDINGNPITTKTYTNGTVELGQVYK